MLSTYWGTFEGPVFFELSFFVTGLRELVFLNIGVHLFVNFMDFGYVQQGGLSIKGGNTEMKDLRKTNLLLLSREELESGRDCANIFVIISEQVQEVGKRIVIFRSSNVITGHRDPTN